MHIFIVRLFRVVIFVVLVGMVGACNTHTQSPAIHSSALSQYQRDLADLTRRGTNPGRCPQGAMPSSHCADTISHGDTADHQYVSGLLSLLFRAQYFFKHHPERYGNINIPQALEAVTDFHKSLEAHPLKDYERFNPHYLSDKYLHNLFAHAYSRSAIYDLIDRIYSYGIYDLPGRPGEIDNRCANNSADFTFLMPRYRQTWQEL